MVAVKITISLTIILILSLRVHSALGAKPAENTKPGPYCSIIGKESFNFLPLHTRVLGVFCALGHGEKLTVDGIPTNVHDNWVGTLDNKGLCSVCCARGNGSDTIFYSTLARAPPALCKKN
uniref:Putative secreted protein n=1 Tax=Amblyomma americanum TaxID=6943 RepID=A0A0C9S437_AMBAM